MMSVWSSPRGCPLDTAGGSRKSQNPSHYLNVLPLDTMGYLRVTIRYLRVTMGYLRVTTGYLRVTISWIDGVSFFFPFFAKIFFFSKISTRY